MSFNGKFPPGLFPRDLIAHWRFHPSENMADSTYNGFDLTNTSTTVETVNAHDGYYCTFNATSSKLARTDSLLDNIEPFSIDAWINPVGLGENNGGRIICKENVSGAAVGRWVFALTATSTITFTKGCDVTNLTVTAGNNSVTFGEWNHVAVTWDGTIANAETAVHLYVNGAETSYSTQQAGADNKSTDATLPLCVGNANDAARTFNGTIGPLRFWRKVLTPQQVGWLYNRQR